MIIRFTIPGPPIPWRTPKVVKRANSAYPIAIKDERLRSYQNLAALAAAETMAGRDPFDRRVPLELWLTVVLPVPASWSKKRRAMALNGQLWPTVRPDLSNYLDAVLDGCNNVVWEDDSQLVRMHPYKLYGLGIGVTVECRPLLTALDERRQPTFNLADPREPAENLQAVESTVFRS
jgi:Holliday junction resolvase RusA-like endonuclease